VLTGTFAAVLGGHEIEAGPARPRLQAAGPVAHVLESGRCPDAVLEIISPAGLEEFFRLVDAPEAEQDPHKIAEWSRVGGDIEQAATAALVERHGLRF